MRRFSGRINLLLLISVLVCGYAISNVWIARISETAGIDYFQFWIVGQAERIAAPNNIYSRHSNDVLAKWSQTMVSADLSHPTKLSAVVRFWEPNPSIKTMGTPFLFAVVNSLAQHDGPWMSRYYQDLNTYATVCMFCTVGSILGLCLALGYGSALAMLFVAAIYFWFAPLISDTQVGNVAQLQLAGLSLFILTRKYPSFASDVAGGLLLGLLTAFKPTMVFVPILVGAVWFFDKRWKTLLIQMTSGILGLFIAFFWGCVYLQSWSAWTNWIHVLSSATDQSVMLGNYVLSRVIMESVGPKISWLLIILTLGLSIFILWKTREVSGKLHPFHRDYLAAALGSTAAIIALPLAWLHYYVLLLPLLIFLCSPALTTPSNWKDYGERALAVIALLLLLYTPLQIFVGIKNAYIIAGLFITGAWMLFFLGLRCLRHSGEFKKAALRDLQLQPTR